MNRRRRISVVAAAGAAVAVTAGAVVAIAANGATDGSADANAATTALAPEPFGESELPSGEATAGTGSESVTAPEEPALPVSKSRKLDRTFVVKTKDPVFFITIDDGNTKSDEALKYVTRNRIPTTVFLTDVAVAGQWDYFRKFAAPGGTIENHTMTHQSLTSGSTDLSYEICRPQTIYGAKFDRIPTMLRPPYGNGGYSTTPKKTRKAIDATASACGVQHIVMWNAVAEKGSFKFIRGSLKRGDIVLFHFTPSLAGELKTVMSMAAKKGLRPAPLTDYLK